MEVIWDRPHFSWGPGLRSGPPTPEKGLLFVVSFLVPVLCPSPGQNYHIPSVSTWGKLGGGGKKQFDIHSFSTQTTPLKGQVFLGVPVLQGFLPPCVV